MKYTLTETGIRYEFTLWFRHRSREIPFARVRGHELRQDRIQRLFRVGSVSILTGGTNASLRFVEFSNVPNPSGSATLCANGALAPDASRVADRAGHSR